jgi:hypothetical protein
MDGRRPAATAMARRRGTESGLQANSPAASLAPRSEESASARPVRGSAGTLGSDEVEVVDLDSVAGWRVSRRVDSAEALHARRPVEGREVVLCRVTRAAVVLGSTEPLSDLDLAACAAEGLEVARRPSGGASVLVVPGEQAWIEVRVPRGDPWWQEDVGRAFHRIGEVWRDALSELGVEGEVHRGPLRSSRWSSRACFCGVGPGEVLVEVRDKKKKKFRIRRKKDGGIKIVL